MTVFDYIMIAIVGLSSVFAYSRGLIAEIFSLGTWIVSFWAAKHFANIVAVFMPVQEPALRVAVGFFAALIACWLVCVVIKKTLTSAVDVVGLGGLNRLMGLLFGCARGVLMAVVLVLIGGLTKLPQTPEWQHAMFAPPLENAALSLRPWLPDMVAQKINYT